MPAGVPEVQVAEVRRAFVAMIKDPVFLADAQKRNLEISDPKSGEEITTILADVYASSEDSIAAARHAISEGAYKMKDESKK
jgi:hypothetical protein